MRSTIGKATFGVICFSFLCLSSQAFAQLSAEVNVDVTQDGDLYTYEYTVSNSILSSTSVSAFSLDVINGDVVVEGDDVEFGVRSLVTPANWAGEYQPYELILDENFEATGIQTDGDGEPRLNRSAEVFFISGDGQDCSDDTGDIFAGEELTFSVTSKYGPGTQSYDLWKITDGEFGICSEFPGLTTGSILAPTIAPAVTLACDVDGDGDCDLVDIDSLSSAITGGSVETNFDVNGDGSVDAMDIDSFLADEEVNKLNGDLDFNGSVEFADFLVLSNNFGNEGLVWSGGDLAPNGKAEFEDFLILSNNFGQAVAASAVPEPSAIGLFAFAVAGLTLIRRRRD